MLNLAIDQMSSDWIELYCFYSGEHTYKCMSNKRNLGFFYTGFPSFPFLHLFVNYSKLFLQPAASQDAVWYLLFELTFI